MREAAAAGLVEGYPDGSFRSDRSLSRAEAALMVVRLLEYRAVRPPG
ncbi:MAG: S-layer homology domain-containing protein [Clostridia bacterium]|nr:S-layer homology domain-containing protein [Clostridia bacterium]